MNHRSITKTARIMTVALAVNLTFGLSIPAYAEASPAPQAAATASTITGEVLDSMGEPVIGASVKPADPSVQAVVTDIDGHFTIKSTKKVKLTISYIGCKDVVVEAVPGQPINVTLEDDTNALDEVVVVGFATQKKVNLTGSVGVASSKDIAGRPVQSTAAALQGVIPGLNISNSSTGGQLNAEKSVNIRGTGTIGGNSSGSPLILIDGMEGDMSSVNPNDIESISVLKDAAASSIYGSRAPFGVIMITTKSGSAGKAQIHYNNSFRWNEPLNPMEMMDSWEYINYRNDAARGWNSVDFDQDRVDFAYAYYTGQSDQFVYENKWQGESRRWGTGENGGVFANVNWKDELYKKSAFAQEHNVTLTGGNDKVTYYVSGNYLGQGGFLKYGNDNYQRYTMMGKFSAQMFSWLKLQYTGRWMRVDYEKPSIMQNSGDGELGFFEKLIRRLPPTNPKYDPNGYIAADYNYIEHLTNGGREKEQNDFFTNQVKLIITPLKNWNINLEFNSRISNHWTHRDNQVVYAHDADDLEGLSHETTHVAFDSGDHNSVYEYSRRTTYLNYNLYTDYSFTFAEKNNMKVLLGFQAEDEKYRQLSASRQDMQVTTLPILDLTTSKDSYSLGGNYQKWRTAGFFGRINYDFDGKYLAEFNLRYDGSSRFRKDHRWVWSPSASIGWNIDRENFWESIRPYVPGLKIRGSYGQLSNQNTNSWYPTYRTMGLSTNGSNWLVNGQLQNSAWFPSLVTPGLTWEKIKNTNIGIDISALRYRLTASFDYFWRQTDDMIGPAVKYPSVFGANVPGENSLSLRTSGWELTLGWQDHVGDFNYSAKFNLSDDRCKVLEYPNPEKLFASNQNLMQTYYVKGEYLGEIYGFQTVGIAQTQEEMDAHLAKVNQDAIGNEWRAGDIMYADLNGDGKITRGTGLNDLGDLKKIGNSAPRFRFGLNLFAEWKGIDLTLFFQGVGKRDYYFSPYGGQGTTGKGSVFWGHTGNVYESIFLEQHLDYWRDENSLLGANYNAYYGRPGMTKNKEFQTRFLQDASYIRLKNLQVGYTFPKAWTKKFACEKLRLYFSGENLWTGTKMSKVIDPESLEVSNMKSGSSYPIAKTYSFGLSIDF